MANPYGRDVSALRVSFQRLGFMTEPRPILPVRVYSQREAHELFRAWVTHLGITREDVDELCGLAHGHAGHLLAPNPGARIEFKTIMNVAVGLGLGLMFFEDQAGMKRLRSKVRLRQLPEGDVAVSRAGKHSRKPCYVSKRHLRRIASLGGLARAAKLSPERRQAISRKGGKARKNGHVST